MLKIDQIILHHSGTLGQDPYVSTAHLTVQHVDNAHKARWDFPSKYIKTMAGVPHYSGYTVIYTPHDRKFTQTRAIGEETAHTTGMNFRSVGICIVSNFTKSPDGSVDPLTKQIEDDVTLFLNDLIDGNKRKLVVAPGTVVNLSASRIHPHRFYQETECYGTAISDNHFRDLVIAYRPSMQIPNPNGFTSTELKRRATLLQLYMRLLVVYQKLIDAMKTERVAGHGGMSCNGRI